MDQLSAAQLHRQRRLPARDERVPHAVLLQEHADRGPVARPHRRQPEARRGGHVHLDRPDGIPAHQVGEQQLTVSLTHFSLIKCHNKLVLMYESR